MKRELCIHHKMRETCYACDRASLRSSKNVPPPAACAVVSRPCFHMFGVGAVETHSQISAKPNEGRPTSKTHCTRRVHIILHILWRRFAQLDTGPKTWQADRYISQYRFAWLHQMPDPVQKRKQTTTNLATTSQRRHYAQCLVASATACSSGP